MIAYFLNGDAEKLNTSLIENGLPEDLCTYLWTEVHRAYHSHYTSRLAQLSTRSMAGVMRHIAPIAAFVFHS